MAVAEDGCAGVGSIADVSVGSRAVSLADPQTQAVVGEITGSGRRGQTGQAEAGIGLALKITSR